MIAHNRQQTRRAPLASAAARLTILSAVAVTGSVLMAAGGSAVRLVGVSSQDNALLIEAAEPVAYAVSRPDALTLLVDLRNVSVGDARNDAQRGGAIAGVRLEQAPAVDGAEVARVRVSLARPSEYRIRSARNTIRLELSPSAVRTAEPVKSAARPQPIERAAKPVERAATPPERAAAAPPAQRQPDVERAVPSPNPKSAGTIIERIRASRAQASVTVTLSGNGQLVPARVSESEDEPRRLILDFPNVSSTAAKQMIVESQLVRKVRVGVNSHQPLVTRVVMEIGVGTTYHVERSGQAGRDLAVVFEAPAASTAKVLVAPPDQAVAESSPEPAITMEQAIRNAAAMAPTDTPLPDAMSALQPRPAARVVPGPSLAMAPAPSPSAPAPSAMAPGPSAMAPGPTSSAPVPSEMAPGPSPSAPAPSAMAPSPLPSAPAARAPGSSYVAPPERREEPAPAQQRPPAKAAAPRSTPRVTPPPSAPAPSPTPSVSPRQTPPAPQPQGVHTPGLQGDKKYTGHPISMDFNGMDLRAVIRALADTSGLNIIVDPDVAGSVDIVLNDVPWDQALDVILRANQLDYTVDGTIVRIAKIDTLKRENDSRQALAKSAADAGSLTYQTFALSYAKAGAVAPLLKTSQLLSTRGQVQIDERTNTLIVADLAERFGAIRQILNTIDRPEPQVEVEARIVQTTRDFARAVGIQWGLNGRVMPDVGNTTSLAFPNQGTLGGRLGTQGATDVRAGALEQSATAVNLGVKDANSAIGLALGAVNGAFNLDVALSALERTGKGRVLSTPRLTTQNNIEAEVAQGIQIPIQTVANNTVTVSFKDAVLVLKVTPQITAANTVIMKITIENATPDFSRQVNGIPPIDTQRANTQVQINDGATTVIGGIFVSQEQQSNERTPLLHRVPLLGWLFKRDRLEDQSRELLIFITPRILKG